MLLTLAALAAPPLTPLPPLGTLLTAACPSGPRQASSALPAVTLRGRQTFGDTRKTQLDVALTWASRRSPPSSPPRCPREAVVDLARMHGRLRDRGERIPPADRLASALLILRLQEIEAALDALTDGRVSGGRTAHASEER